MLLLLRGALCLTTATCVQAALLLGKGAHKNALNRTQQTAEQLAPADDRHFHFKASASARAASAISDAVTDEILKKRADHLAVVKTIRADEKVVHNAAVSLTSQMPHTAATYSTNQALAAKKREYEDRTKYPQARSVSQALQWLIERHLINHEGAMVSQEVIRSKWLNDWVIYDIILHKFEALVGFGAKVSTYRHHCNKCTIVCRSDGLTRTLWDGVDTGLGKHFYTLCRTKIFSTKT